MNLILKHVNNPDIAGGYWEKPISPRHQTIAVETLREARNVFDTWRDENGFGGGNMASDCGKVIDNGKTIGRFSYNGRFWDTNGNEVTI